MRKSKYRNKKTVVDNIIFDSLKEARRYFHLKYLETEEVIQDLKLQVKFDLLEAVWINPDTKRKANFKVNYRYKSLRKATSYIADFTYVDNGIFVVEDVKGFKTAVYKKKRDQMKLLYNIIILET